VHHRSIRRGRRRIGQLSDEPGAPQLDGSSAAGLGPRYSPAGPAVRLGAVDRHDDRTDSATPVAEVSGIGQPRRATGFARSVRLEGRTDADFNGGDFHTEKGRTRPATACAGCTADDCIRATGTLVIDFRAPTRVTVPSVADFPNLTPCQVRRVRAAIDNVLKPHEQQHVRAFGRYDGTVTRPFDLTLCRDAFDARIQAMVDAIEAPRRKAAQDASDALDPFFFDVDIDCTEPVAPPPGGRRAAADLTSAGNEEGSA
jgi:hypothetical protein